MRRFPAPPRVHVLHVPGADPARDECVRQLSEQADLCVHPDPDRHGVMGNFTGAVRCAAEDADELTWTTIVNDDLILIPGWQQQLERACTRAPAPILGLTHLGRYGVKIAERGAAYGVGTCLVWGAGIAYRTGILTRLLPFCEAALRIGYPHDDLLVAAFARREGYGTAMTARAIFDLLPTSEAPSLLGHGGRNRVPGLTIRDVDAPDWHAGAVNVSRWDTREIVDLQEKVVAAL